MKLICVTTEYNHYNSCPIKVGEVYEVNDTRTFEDKFLMIYVNLGDGTRMEFVKTSFITLEEYRNKSIDSILNNEV